jgi:hypothetical protein
MKKDRIRQHSRTDHALGEQRRVSEIRREREFGNWGRASEHIGRRWEELGFSQLSALATSRFPWPTDRYKPLALVPLMSDAAIQASLARIGLPSPDVIVVLADGSGEFVLQALDFKWDLEFATYDQIRATALSALLDRDAGVLAQALVRAVERVEIDGPCVDGLLFAPDSPANRRFLSSVANQRQEYPIEEKEVILVAVEPDHFFSNLPGWDMAIRVAELDRAIHSLRTLEGAERYYRLGAGLLGAVSQLQCSIFEESPPLVDAEGAIAWLQAWVRPMTSVTLIGHVERVMATRAQHVARLRRLIKSPYRWVDLERELASRGMIVRTDQGDEVIDRERWREVIRHVGAEYKDLVMRTGRRLKESGLSDSEVLAQLDGDLPRLSGTARMFGKRRVELMMAQGG